MKKIFTTLFVLELAGGLVGCGEEPQTGSDAGRSAVGRDAGGGGDSGGGGGGNTRSWTGPAARSSEGVLTNRPEMTFSGSGDLAVTSAYLVLHRLSSFNSVQAWGEVENQTSELQCIPLFDLSIGGVDITAVIDGPAYRVTSSGVTSACIQPGAKGSFKAIKNEVPATLLDGASSFVYTITGIQSSSAERHPAEPRVFSPRIGAVSGGYGVSGEIETTSMVIHNFGMEIYARDVSGLLFDDANAFPGDLETLPANMRIAFESYPVTEGGAAQPSIDGPFEGFELYHSFIEGAKTLRREDSPWNARLDEAAARKAALREARRMLEVPQL